MKKLLRGIALILFGILLTLVRMDLHLYLPGDYSEFFSLIGLGVGIAGVIMVFQSKDEK